MSKRSVKIFIYRILQFLRIMPNIWMIRNPFKIHEFFEVVSGSALEKHHVILDLGCEKGLQTQLLARYCKRVIGVDIDEKPIAEAKWHLRNSCVRRKVEFLCARLEEADLPASSLDRVFSLCVLEHIPNLSRVLAEVKRLLKPGGELHVSVDSLATVNDPILLAKHKQDHLVVQHFTRESLRRQLQDAGLEVMEIFPISTSEFARREFELRIRQRNYDCGFVRRILYYKRLRDEDKRARGADGIMLVGRARRPAMDGRQTRG